MPTVRYLVHRSSSYRLFRQNQKCKTLWQVLPYLRKYGSHFTKLKPWLSIMDMAFFVPFTWCMSGNTYVDVYLLSITSNCYSSGCFVVTGHMWLLLFAFLIQVLFLLRCCTKIDISCKHCPMLQDHVVHTLLWSASQKCASTLRQTWLHKFAWQNISCWSRTGPEMLCQISVSLSHSRKNDMHFVCSRMPRELCEGHSVHIQTPKCLHTENNLRHNISGETVQDTGPRLFLQWYLLGKSVYTVALCFSLEPRVLSLWPHRQSHPQTTHRHQQPHLTNLPTKEHKAWVLPTVCQHVNMSFNIRLPPFTRKHSISSNC